MSQTIISMLVITSPFDPVKILFFNQAIKDPPRNRTASAAKVAFGIIIVLGVTALIGRQFLDLVGVNLDAFGVVGGLMIAVMGAEMLYGGGASSTQGESVRERGPDQDDALLIPLTMPLIAGPGAIATTITIATRGEGMEGVGVTLIGAGVVAVVAFVSYAWLGGVIAKANPKVVAIGARLGGLLLATIGVQMLLGGLKNFFA